jgi:hypothetical protein
MPRALPESRETLRFGIDFVGIGSPKKRKAWRGRRMRQALNLIDNWEEEDVVDPSRTTLGGGVRRPMNKFISRTGMFRQAGSVQCSNALGALLSICSPCRCHLFHHHGISFRKAAL